MIVVEIVRILNWKTIDQSGLSFSTALTLCDSLFPFGFFLRPSHDLNDLVCSSEIASERFNEIVRQIDSTLYLELTYFFVSSFLFPLPLFFFWLSKLFRTFYYPLVVHISLYSKHVYKFLTLHVL